MTDVALDLDAIMTSVRASLVEKHRAREQALTLSREAIRHSANAIRAIHRNEYDSADSLIERVRAQLSEVDALLQEHRDIYYAGFVADAQKEFAEASLTSALVRRLPLPSPAELNLGPAPYLNGLGEAVGELRRFLLDVLRSGDTERCEGYLGAMDEIYGALVTVDYPDAITGGLRRTTDLARGILERTRGDLTLAVQQYTLQRELRAFQERLPQP
jgi:translin